MSALLSANPYGQRDDATLLAELNALSSHHLAGCPPYRAMWPQWAAAQRLQDLPFVHVGVFKSLLLSTAADGLKHQRVLLSSATGSGGSSQVQLDDHSAELQARSTRQILQAWLGDGLRPLLVLDDARSLRGRGPLSARLAAALSLRPLASDLHFVLPDQQNPASMRWDAIDCACDGASDLLVYGFTWILWLALASGDVPERTRELLRQRRVWFVHSGGWKKMEALRVDRAEFDQRLLGLAGPGSGVLDYYGLVEQVGVIFPLCVAGARHVPRWAEVLVRDPWTLAAQPQGVGQLQFMNSLAKGAPYHSVLTEDMGELLAGDCPCGRPGRRFTLHGRMAKAELRGCANA